MKIGNHETRIAIMLQAAATIRAGGFTEGAAVRSAHRILDMVEKVDDGKCVAISNDSFVCITHDDKLCFKS